MPLLPASAALRFAGSTDDVQHGPASSRSALQLAWAWTRRPRPLPDPGIVCMRALHHHGHCTLSLFGTSHALFRPLLAVPAPVPARRSLAAVTPPAAQPRHVSNSD